MRSRLAPPPTPSGIDTEPFRIGGWLIEPGLLRATSGDNVETLEPKVLGVLQVLARHVGEPVARQTFFEVVWAGTVVGEDVLTRAVSELRKLFDDRARPPRVIETIPRVGYRLLVPVEWSSAPILEPSGDGASPVAPPDARLPNDTRSRPLRWPLALLVGALALGVGYALGTDPPPASAPPMLVPVTSAPGMELTPALSPDGQRVAYAHSHDGQRQLVVSDLDGRVRLQLTDGPGRAWSPAWSPDGREIAFVTFTDPGCVIGIVPALGGPVREVGTCPDTGNTMLDWSPDGERLVFSTLFAPDPVPIRTLDLATGAVADLGVERAGEEGEPRFSPDGRRVLFVRHLSGAHSDLFVHDLDAGQTTRLTDAGGQIVGHAWSGGDRVVYSVLASERTTLWTVPAEGGTPTWVPFPSDQAYRLDATGDHMVFERWQIQTALSRVDATPDAEPLPFAASTAFDYVPTWSPDGRRVAFLSDRSGALEVWTADADGTGLRQITTGGVLCSPARWSPDGQRLAYSALVDGRAEVFVLDGLAADPRQVSAPSANDTHPSWSPDGRWLYVRSDRSGQQDIWRIPAGGGDAHRVTRDGALYAQPSPDGRALYVVRSGAVELWRHPLSEEAPEPIFDGLDLGRLHAWQPVGDGVVVVDRADDAAFDLVEIQASGKRRRIRSLGPGPVPGFALAPDGRQLLIAKVTDRGADLVLASLP